MPNSFRFSVKLPKEITHLRKLKNCDDPLDRFLDEVGHLKEKLAVLLVQLPPQLAFESIGCMSFLEQLSNKVSCAIVCEPRHPSWFAKPVDSLLATIGVARAAADPAVTKAAARPGGSDKIDYFRFHGSPVIYRSSYDDRIESLAKMVRGSRLPGADTWCIFDNTASSAAVGNALKLQAIR